MTIRAKFIRAQAKMLQGYDHHLLRAGELAQEVERLNDAVALAAAKLEFEDEPSRYRVVVEKSRVKGASVKR